MILFYSYYETNHGILWIQPADLFANVLDSIAQSIYHLTNQPSLSLTIQVFTIQDLLLILRCLIFFTMILDIIFIFEISLPIQFIIIFFIIGHYYKQSYARQYFLGLLFRYNLYIFRSQNHIPFYVHYIVYYHIQQSNISIFWVSYCIISHDSYVKMVEMVYCNNYMINSSDILVHVIQSGQHQQFSHILSISQNVCNNRQNVQQHQMKERTYYNFHNFHIIDP